MDERATKQRASWIWKGALIVLGLLVAAVVAVVSVVTGHSTDCFADFPAEQNASRALDTAHALGLNHTDLIRHQRGASIRISSGETGDDAKEFRRTVRVLVAQGGRHLECQERPFFN
jgi:hypothetical protein